MQECCVCKAKEEENQMEKAIIKGKAKYVCKGCATAIKGLV